MGEEKDFIGVIDLVSMKAHTYATDGSGKEEIGDVPAAYKTEADAWRDKISPVLDNWAKSTKGGERVLQAYRAEIEKATNEQR